MGSRGGLIICIIILNISFDMGCVHAVEPVEAENVNAVIDAGWNSADPLSVVLPRSIEKLWPRIPLC